MKKRPRNTLTRRQHQLLRDIDGLVKAMGLSPQQVLSDWAGDGPGITAHLTRITAHLARAEIVAQYTYVDELLGMELFWPHIPRQHAGAGVETLANILGPASSALSYAKAYGDPWLPARS